MARTVKDPDVRRNEILDAAQQFFLGKGYEQTSVQDVLDAAGISKGAFYHYFSSKEELLDRLIERMTGERLVAVQHILDDDRLDACEKMEAFFDFFLQWKTANRRFFLDLMRVLYRDENALFRHKMMAEGTKRVAPLLGDLIGQGVMQGVFDTEYPGELGEIVMTVLRSLSESLVQVLLDEAAGTDTPLDPAVRFERIILAHQAAIERMLGASRPLHLLDVDQTKLFLLEPETG